MKKRLHLPASSLSANISFLNKFARTNSTVKLLTKVGGGGGRREARFFLERDQSVTINEQSLRNFFRKILSSVEHKKNQSRIFHSSRPVRCA